MIWYYRVCTVICCTQSMFLLYDHRLGVTCAVIHCSQKLYSKPSVSNSDLRGGVGRWDQDGLTGPLWGGGQVLKEELVFPSPRATLQMHTGVTRFG